MKTASSTATTAATLAAATSIPVAVEKLTRKKPKRRKKKLPAKPIALTTNTVCPYADICGCPHGNKPNGFSIGSEYRPSCAFPNTNPTPYESVSDSDSVEYDLDPNQGKKQIPITANTHQPRQAENMNGNQRSDAGYTWTIKEILPFLASLIISIASVFQVYTNLSSRITSLEKDNEYMKENVKREVDTIKTSERMISEKLDQLAKSNELLKIQLSEIANVVVKK